MADDAFEVRRKAGIDVRARKDAGEKKGPRGDPELLERAGGYNSMTPFLTA